MAGAEFVPPPVPPEGVGADDDDENLSFDDKVKKTIPSDVRMFTGCKDSQTSADVHNVATFELPAEAGPGGAGGACTNSILSTLSNHTSITWIDLLENMRKILGTKGFSQIPQLSCSRKLDVNTNFNLINEKSTSESAKKALFIGINYVGQKGELRGCHNDVIAMKRLVAKYGFPIDEGDRCAVLLDDGQHKSPTHANIVSAFQWLIEDIKSGDSLFMHYSGHGGYVRDTSGDEKDERDETIIPVDYSSAGQITDDEIFAALVAPIPEGVTFTVVMDCCHSGTVFDLPYIIKADDATIQSIHSGGVAEMHQNPAFTFEKLLKIGKKLLAMHLAGAKPQAIASAGLREIGGAQGAMRLAQDVMAMAKGGANQQSQKEKSGTTTSQVEKAILNVDPSIDKNKDGKIFHEEAQHKAREVLTKAVGHENAKKITSCCIIL